MIFWTKWYYPVQFSHNKPKQKCFLVGQIKLNTNRNCDRAQGGGWTEVRSTLLSTGKRALWQSVTCRKHVTLFRMVKTSMLSVSKGTPHGHRTLVWATFQTRFIFGSLCLLVGVGMSKLRLGLYSVRMYHHSTTNVHLTKSAEVEGTELFESADVGYHHF